MSASKFSNALHLIYEQGLSYFITELWFRSLESYYELVLNVDTKGMMDKNELRQINNPDSIEYVPLGYYSIFSVIKKLPIDKSNSVFIDYGSGKGRAVAVAATFNFKRVVGIELSEHLVEIAKFNVENMRRKKAGKIEILQMDATHFEVPCDANVFYFFNPFVGNVLEKVVNNIYSSYINHPRKLYIVYFNLRHFEALVKNQNWLFKTYEQEIHPNYSCGIFETQVEQ